MLARMTTINVQSCAPEIVDIARRMFKAYVANSGGLTHDRKRVPPWDRLTQVVQSHWCAAALEAVRYTSEVVRYTSEVMRAELDRHPPAKTSRDDAGMDDVSEPMQSASSYTAQDGYALDDSSDHEHEQQTGHPLDASQK